MTAQGIEAAPADKTRSGLAEGESPVRQDAPNSLSQKDSRMTDTTEQQAVTPVRYAAIGETSTEGARWYIWKSGHGSNYVGGKIADQAQACAIADELNRLASVSSASAEGPVDADEFETVEAWEHGDQRELSLLYNHGAHDRPQFNRIQMRQAIRHGKSLVASPKPVPATNQAGEDSARGKAVAAMRNYVASAGVPLTEFDPEFAVRMMGAMMVSFHKYGRVADAYPLKFDAASDVRARMGKYRETGNRHYLVDAANFAMIEAMHSGRKGGSQWGTNDAADSPGRTTASGHRLVQETNDGTRIMGETILHVPGDDA